MEKVDKKHFILVHGICFGAWCWYKVVAQLKSNGHKVTAVDLAASGIHPKRAEEVVSLYDYSEPLMEFMAALPPEERVILVGHGTGGVAISLAMENFSEKIVAAVFIASTMAGPDMSMQEIMDQLKHEQTEVDLSMDCQNIWGNGEDQPPTSIIFGSQFVLVKLCQLSPPEDMSLASMLLRPTTTSIMGGYLEPTALTKKNYGKVRRAYLITEKDNFTNSELQRWMIEKNPPDEVKVIHDSDNMAMFSRPKQLCAYLQDIYEKYN